MSPSNKTHRVSTRCAVKRLCYRCTPIDHHRFSIFITYCETTDMESLNLRGLRVITINTTKHKGCIAEIKLDKAFHQCLINSVAFKTRLKCSSQIGLMHVAHSPRCASAAL